MRINSRTPMRSPPLSAGEVPKPGSRKATGVSGADSPSGQRSVQARNKPRALVSDAFIGGPPDAQQTFRQQFGTLATDPKRFHDTLRTVFGAGYDTTKAEQYRQQTLAGDFGWLPPVRWVEPSVLDGANGAYDAEAGTVLLNRTLDPKLAASTYVEEAGHHLDAKLNAKDTPGDEGELFRRLLGGEKLSPAQLAEIRADDDRGVIVIDGKQKEVEFWKPLKALGKAVKSVVQRVSAGVQGLVTGVASAAVGAARNIGEGLGTFAGGLGQIFKGQWGEGLKQMGMGLVKTFIQTPIDAGLMILGRAVSTIQTLAGLEPPGRKLDPGEIAVLQQIYGNRIDYSAVRIKEGQVGVFGLPGRPFTHGDTVYIPLKFGRVDPDTLVHEMAHVWQHQNGGTDYMSEALWAQNFGDGYEFVKGIQEGKSWRELNPEQQAWLLEKAFAGGFFDGPDQRFKYNGTDYTDYLNAALVQIREGQGAP
jgi:hypothetical protein